MGDVSIIARRLGDGHVQFGWSGNGGYFWSVGAYLLAYYDTPDMVEYLFGLGQLSRISRPQSETSNDKYPTVPIGKPHYLTDSEEKIFRQIHFVDYAYFYDTDQRWYYIHPGIFTFKIDLEAIWRYMERTGAQFEIKYIRRIEGFIVKDIFENQYWKDPEFRRYANERGTDDEAATQTAKKLESILYPNDDEEEDEDALFNFLYDFVRDGKRIPDYFDSWVVVEPDDDMGVSKILMRKREENHMETNQWGK